MCKAEITYIDDEGEERKLPIEGDFELGREKTNDGAKFTIINCTGHKIYLFKCPGTVSRIKIGDEGSPCHARFFWRNNVIYIQDMGSLNGTKVNGRILSGWSKRITSEPYPIDRNSVVELGNTRIEVEPIVPRSDSILSGLGIDKICGGQEINVVIQGNYYAKEISEKRINFEGVNRGNIEIGDDGEPGKNNIDFKGVNRGNIEMKKRREHEDDKHIKTDRNKRNNIIYYDDEE